jgi:DNA-binding NarL/FixJ family response regulator
MVVYTTDGINMGSLYGSILLLTKHPRQIRVIASLLRRLRYSVTVACTEDQAIAQTATYPPFLVIVTGNHQDWSENFLLKLRSHPKMLSMTLIALADFHAPNWVYQEENPGFDGFLVSPISSEVLFFLVQSAYMRQNLCSAS